MTWPLSAGTRAFKKLKKQPQSKRWFHGRKARPVTLKKPNCLLQREKATSCHKPCSGKNPQLQSKLLPHQGHTRVFESRSQ